MRSVVARRWTPALGRFAAARESATARIGRPASSVPGEPGPDPAPVTRIPRAGLDSRAAARGSKRAGEGPLVPHVELGPAGRRSRRESSELETRRAPRWDPIARRAIPEEAYVVGMLRRCATPEAVLEVFESESGAFDLVNFAAATHRLLTLYHAKAPWKRLPLPRDRMLTFVAAMRTELEAQKKAPEPRAIATLAWGLGRLDVTDRDLFVRLASAAVPQVGSFGSADVAMMLYGFSRLGFRHKDLLDRIAERVAAKPLAYKTVELSSILVSYASLAHPSRVLFDAATVELMRRLRDGRRDRDWNPQILTNVVHSFAKAGFVDSPLFHACLPRLRADAKRMTPQALANVAWAYSKAGVFDVDLFRDLARALAHPQRANAATPQNLALAADAFAAAVRYAESLPDLVVRDESRSGADERPTAAPTPSPLASSPSSSSETSEQRRKARAEAVARMRTRLHINRLFDALAKAAIKHLDPVAGGRADLDALPNRAGALLPSQSRGDEADEDNDAVASEEDGANDDDAVERDERTTTTTTTTATTTKGAEGLNAKGSNALTLEDTFDDVDLPPPTRAEEEALAASVTGIEGSLSEDEDGEEDREDAFVEDGHNSSRSKRKDRDQRDSSAAFEPARSSLVAPAKSADELRGPEIERLRREAEARGEEFRGVVQSAAVVQREREVAARRQPSLPFNAHDVATVLSAFHRVEVDNDELFRKLADRVQAVATQLTAPDAVTTLETAVARLLPAHAAAVTNALTTQAVARHVAHHSPPPLLARWVQSLARSFPVPPTIFGAVSAAARDGPSRRAVAGHRSLDETSAQRRAALRLAADRLIRHPREIDPQLLASTLRTLASSSSAGGLDDVDAVLQCAQVLRPHLDSMSARSLADAGVAVTTLATALLPSLDAISAPHESLLVPFLRELDRVAARRLRRQRAPLDASAQLAWAAASTEALWGPHFGATRAEPSSHLRTIVADAAWVEAAVGSSNHPEEAAQDQASLALLEEARALWNLPSAVSSAAETAVPRNSTAETSAFQSPWTRLSKAYTATASAWLPSTSPIAAKLPPRDALKSGAISEEDWRSRRLLYTALQSLNEEPMEESGRAARHPFAPDFRLASGRSVVVHFPQTSLFPLRGASPGAPDQLRRHPSDRVRDLFLDRQRREPVVSISLDRWQQLGRAWSPGTATRGSDTVAAAQLRWLGEQLEASTRGRRSLRRPADE